MARMTGGEAIVKALAHEGVKVAFGLPGVQLYGIVTAFRDEPMRFITVRHEGSSTYMADGYARASGGVGGAVAVPGPGLLNAAAGRLTAPPRGVSGTLSRCPSCPRLRPPAAC